MIKLDVAAYCHDCPGFKAVSDIQVLHDEDYGKSLCISITCVNHKQCKHIHRYLERKVKETEEIGKKPIDIDTFNREVNRPYEAMPGCSTVGWKG